MKVAKAKGRFLPISLKQSIEVCRALRGLKVEEAIRLLDDVIAKERAIPFKRYGRDVSHRREIGAGRYPIKVCRYIKQVLSNAIANAKGLGMEEDRLYINKIAANQAFSREQIKGTIIGKRKKIGGRKRGAHIEIELVQR